MARKAFSAVVRADGPEGKRGSVEVPFSVEREWRSQGAVRVKGTLNGQPLRARLVPQGDGSHRLPLPARLMAKAKCFVGDTVRVELEPEPLEPAGARTAQAARLGGSGAASAPGRASRRPRA